MEKETIIKALEIIVGEEEIFCEVCPYKGAYCNRLVLCGAIALIKELTEENESLRDYCDKFLNRTSDLVDSERKVARKYAVRKMQERLKAVCWSCIMTNSTIDRIAEEILEE